MTTTAPHPDGRTVVPAVAKGKGRWRRRLVALIVALAVLVTALGVGAAVVYVKLDGNILSEDVGSRLGVRPKSPPPAAGGRGPLNILVMGSDTRAGANAEYAGGDIEGERSDTAILLHLSADRQRATAVSIPRDTQVTIPACTRADGSRTAEHQGMFNSAYQLAGSACTIQTVESLTGIYINHHVVVDFSGFKRMVDALGGVNVCLPKPVRDVRSGLDLPAGRQEVDGEQALAYVRTRYALGDGSDLSRIERQQVFLAAMIQKASSSEVLTRPDRLISFLDAATQSVTTDPELASLNDLSSLARQVQGIGLDRVRFLTAPNQPWPVNPNRVQLTPAADELWRLLREDAPLPGERGAARPSAAATPGPSATPALRTRPEQVRVRVLNGSGQPRAATRAAEDLRRAGFQVVAVGNAPGAPVTRSVVRHDPVYDESGRALSAAVLDSTVEVVPELGGALELVVGTGYRGLAPVAVAPSEGPSAGASDSAGATAPGPDPALTGRTADKDVCS